MRGPIFSEVKIKTNSYELIEELKYTSRVEGSIT
jgi:hypothetical protein